VEILAGDLTDLSLGQKAVDLAIQRFGRLDGLVVNHGAVEPVQKIVDADLNEWKEAFDLNVFSAIAMVELSYDLAIVRLLTSLGQSRDTIVASEQGSYHPYILWSCCLRYFCMGVLRGRKGSIESPRKNTCQRGT